ncbi:hypothetical protein EDC04DRAFT_2634060, partial [Pisolithus marmoratus]
MLPGQACSSTSHSTQPSTRENRGCEVTSHPGKSKARIRPQLGLTRGSGNQKSGDLMNDSLSSAVAEDSHDVPFQEDTRRSQSTSGHLPLVTGRAKEETRVCSSDRRASSKSSAITCTSRKASVTCQVATTELTTRVNPVHGVSHSGQEIEPELPFSVLQQRLVSHESLSEGVNEATMETDIARGVLGLRSPELNAWIRGTQKETDGKQTLFSRPNHSEEGSNGHAGPSIAHGSQEWGDELALQVSPRRPMAAPSWTSPPHAQPQPSTNLGM